MKKQIDMLTQLLEKNNISLPNFSKKREGGSNLEYKERVHSLVAEDSRVDSKSKKKAKNPPEQKRDKNKSPEEPQGSKKNPQKKKNKGKMSKCIYCSKGNPSKSSCMKKKIDMLTQLLENNGISLPKISKKREGGSSLDDRESSCIGCWHIKLTQIYH